MSADGGCQFRRKVSCGLVGTFALAGAAWPAATWAQEPSPSLRADAERTLPAARSVVGLNEGALPGIVNLGLPALRSPGTWAVSASSGYGYTESQTGEAGSHHRVAGSLAVGFTPLAGLDLSLRLAGRRDGHPADAQGEDASYSGEPRLQARYGRRLGDAVFGGELGVRVPGRDAPSLAFDAAVLDLKLQAGWLAGPLTWTAMGGFRLDRSAEAKPDLDRTRFGDRMALGLSDFNAALVGLGAVYRHRATEWLLEASADLLLGAPSLAQSPMRVAAGVRQHVGEHWQLFALVQASPSERPDLDPQARLVPIEPRAAVNIGLAFVGGLPSATRSDAPADFAGTVEEPAVAEPPPVVAEPTQPATPAGQLRGLIRSFQGRGLRATIRVAPLGAQAETDEDGSFMLDVPPGNYEVEIEAAGFKPQRREVKVEENGVTILNADLRLDRGRP